MIAHIPEPLKLLGRLETSIVGIQYYDGAKALDSPEVVLKRTPENPHDANAIAVYTPQDCPIGHLPRHDAAYFAPLVDNGIVVLKGKAGKSEKDYRLPVTLEIYGTSKSSELFAPDERNDWRAIFHNLFIGLWEHLDQYSCAALQEFRNRFRPLAHEQELYPKTQLFYRMLKTHIAELDQREESRLRELIVSAVVGMNFGSWTGWPDFAVIPLDAASTPGNPPAGAASSEWLPEKMRTPEMLRLLPTQCPYPPGSHGSVLLVNGDLHSLDWFASTECSQVYWFQPLVDANRQIEEPSSDFREDMLPRPPGEAKFDVTPQTDKPLTYCREIILPVPPEEAKAEILAALQAAAYLAKQEGADGKTAIQIFGVANSGIAIFRAGVLECLRLRPAGCPLPGTNPDSPSMPGKRPSPSRRG